MENTIWLVTGRVFNTYEQTFNEYNLGFYSSKEKAIQGMMKALELRDAKIISKEINGDTQVWWYDNGISYEERSLYLTPVKLDKGV